MSRILIAPALFALIAFSPRAYADDSKKPAAPAPKPAAVAQQAAKKPAAVAQQAAKKPAAAASPVSFLKEVAPIFARQCVACHNTRKSESKYIMTTFAQLIKGGRAGEGITVEPGDPEASYLIELIQPKAEPRMPYKQDPLAQKDIDTITRWVAAGAKYDGASATEDWTTVLRKSIAVKVPESYPTTMPITALAFTPDGQGVATSGYHEVNLWKTADGSVTGRVRPLSERTYDIAYSPDGKFAATAAGDPGVAGTLTLWAVQPDSRLVRVRDLVDSTDCVFAVAFSPDGKTLVSAGADRAIRFWEIPAGKLVGTIEDHADWILDVAFSPDGKRLATASRDKTSKVFDAVKRESIATFPVHASTVHAVAFSPDGKLVISSGEDQRIRYWNPDDEAKQVREVAPGGTMFKILLTPDGKELLAAGTDRQVHAFAAADGKPLRAYPGHADWIYSLAISRDGKTLASGGWDGEVRLWTEADAKLIRAFVAAPGFKPAAKAQASAK